MTEIIDPNNNRNLPSTQQQIDLDTFKSIFYWTNVKADTQIKFFRKKRKLELSDIHDLNERVQKKLAIHNVVTSIISLNFLLEDSNLRQYGTWGEFERENWELVNHRTNSVNLTWDMTFKIEGFELPQRHTMKVRIGNAIPPKDMFQLMFTSDEPRELMESQAEGLVKIDFINQVLANELLKIAEEWNSGLEEVNEVNSIVKFIDDKENYIKTIVNFLIPIFLMFLVYSYHGVLCDKLGLQAVLNMDTLQRTLILFSSVYAFGYIFARYINRWLGAKISKFKYSNGINISKGDKNHLKEMKNDNSKVLREILIRFGITLLVSIIMIFIKTPIENLLY